MSFDNEYFINPDYTKLRRNVQINYLRTKYLKPKSIAFEKVQNADFNYDFDHKNIKNILKHNKSNKTYSRYKNADMGKIFEPKSQAYSTEKDYLSNSINHHNDIADFKISLSRKANRLNVSHISFESFKTSLKDNQSDVRSNVSEVKLKIKFKKLARIVCTILSFFSYARKKFTTKSIINELDAVIFM